MKIIPLIVSVLLCISLPACSSGNPQQLLETAQFEEKQTNKEHAAKLYREILAKYPDSTQAKIAQERLPLLQ